MSSGEQFLIIHVLGSPWHHIENVKELFLPKDDQFAQLFSSDFLRIGSLMVYDFAHYELSLLHKLFQILSVDLLLLRHHLSDFLRDELILQSLHVHCWPDSWSSLEIKLLIFLFY